MVKVDVSALAIDAATNMPIMLLKEENGDRVLPIWVGFPEASAIAMAQSYVRHEIERPMTHDLMKLILDGLGGTLIKIVIDELEGTTYKAKLFLQTGDTDCYIDARPSDAVALALRMGAPIFVADAVIEPQTDNDGSGSLMENIDELRKRLREIDPSDFGKFSF
ncbi:MAG: bifunctional nuclease family protein [Fibrobacteres bacterium]|nr:bifunctional nuclease family protein [Fibrobacterota bacterium]